RRAGAIALLVAAIAAIEAGDHTHAPLAARGLGVDERLHFVAPFLAFIGAANIAQIVQRAEDLGEALEAAVEGGHPGFSVRGRAQAAASVIGATVAATIKTRRNMDWSICADMNPGCGRPR